MIDRKDAYNMQILEDWNSFRWSRFTLSNPAAKLMRMKVGVFSDSDSWAMKLEDVWNEHGFVEKLNLAAREGQFILGRTTRCHC